MAVVRYTLTPGDPDQPGRQWSSIDQIGDAIRDGWLKSTLEEKLLEIIDLYPPGDTASIEIVITNQGTAPPDTR